MNQSNHKEVLCLCNQFHANSFYQPPVATYQLVTATLFPSNWWLLDGCRQVACVTKALNQFAVNFVKWFTKTLVLT